MSMDYKEQYGKIYRYCYYRLRHRETAEDITQETFLRFFKHSEYHSAGYTSALLYRIAGNLCVDELRKKKPEVWTAEFDEEYMPELLPVSGTEENEDAVLTRHVLTAAMAGLEREERELVFLRYVNEMPMSDIAKLKGMSRFAVRRRCDKALRKLRREMEGN